MPPQARCRSQLKSTPTCRRLDYVRMGWKPGGGNVSAQIERR
jgi:hypothetical protein